MRQFKSWLRTRVLRPWVVGRVDNAGPRVALTFDDGPHAEITPRVLDVLDRYGAKASFFCVGENLRRHQDLAEQIQRRGHELANHSMTHAELVDIDYAATAREFDDTFALLSMNERSIVTQSFIRPPKGVINLNVMRYCAMRKKRIIHWSRDPEDFLSRRADQVLEGFERRPLVSGDIVLLHDKMPHSAEVVDGILAGLSQRGLGCVTVSDLLRAGRSART